jgi:hypothetical protein
LRPELASGGADLGAKGRPEFLDEDGVRFAMAGGTLSELDRPGTALYLGLSRQSEEKEDATMNKLLKFGSVALATLAVSAFVSLAAQAQAPRRHYHHHHHGHGYHHHHAGRHDSGGSR